MQIKSLTLKNFRGFKDTEISFSEGLTVLVGVNGAGKSSVLDALAMLLSQVSSQWKDSIDRINIRESDVHADSDFASLETCVEYKSDSFIWKLSRSRGRDERKSELPNDLNTLGGAIRQSLTRTQEPIAGPVLIYYPAIRLVLDVPIPPPPDAGLLQPIEAYAGCLAARAENFHDFFKWFRAREDYENERIREEGRSATPDVQLKTIREALKDVLPGFSNPLVRRFLDTIVMEKNGTALRIDRLSDGEKLLFAIVGDIARRLAMLNPGLESPLHGEGVVMIDEIEQHLHPAWQRTILGNLSRTFPKVQFIVSTHSPQVLGEVPHESIRILDHDPERGQQAYLPSRSLGLDSSAILEEIFGAGRRNQDVSRKLDSIFELIDADGFEQATRQIDALESELGANIPELIEARTMIAMLGGVGAEHR